MATKDAKIPKKGSEKVSEGGYGYAGGVRVTKSDLGGTNLQKIGPAFKSIGNAVKTGRISATNAAKMIVSRGGKYNLTNLKSLFNSVKEGRIGVLTALRMLKGGHIGSGLLPTTGKKIGSTLQVPGTKKAKGGIVQKFSRGGAVNKPRGVGIAKRGYGKVIR